MRVAVVVVFALLLSSAWVGRLLGAPVLTRAARDGEFPPLRWSAVTDGAWMRAFEGHLRETCPVAYQWRGRYNEVRLRWGVFDSAKVHFGPDGWTFLTSTLSGQVEDSQVAARRSFLARLRARCERLGVTLLAVPVPDKVTLYPEQAFASGELPPGKIEVYDRILAELQAAGFATVDVRTLLRAEQPKGQLYDSRDSHWQVGAVVATAKGIIARMASEGWPVGRGPVRAFGAGGPFPVLVVPDMIGTLPFRVSARHGEVASSAVVAALQEPKDYFEIAEQLEDGSIRVPDVKCPEAWIALAGTSFSKHELNHALPLYLQRAVDTRGVIGGGGVERGLDRVLDAIESGELRARHVVWEFVERLFFAGG